LSSYILFTHEQKWFPLLCLASPKSPKDLLKSLRLLDLILVRLQAPYCKALKRAERREILYWLSDEHSSVGIALGYGLEKRDSRVRFPAGAGKFSLHHRVQNGSGAHAVSYPMDTGALSLGVKRPAREADHSVQSGAEVKE
jgi:hypothetical protein